MNRRHFVGQSLLGSLWLWLTGNSLAAESERPNILWITSEDHGPHLGCYGDLYADTPNLDLFAERGMLFKRAWSTAPVCAAARTALITGVYPPSLGAEHMRSLVSMPAFMKMYPQFLREAGYYCSNNSKEDYNLIKPDGVWDDSSPQGHWRNRPAGQPFFSVFNYTMTHESQIRAPDANTIHDPAGVRVPAYLPDTPEVRSNWAQYYDRITQLDSVVGERLAELEEAGQAKDTIVFFYSDHGSGIPRSKRWPYNSGLHVPMIVYFPDKWRHLAPVEYGPGVQSERLVDFMDLAPTTLSIVGIEPTSYMQGRAFAGPFQQQSKPYMHAFRGRMDDRYDLSRTVTDGRYLYMRHYMPHRIYGQYVTYMFETQATQVWKQRYDEGRLNEVQRKFWEPKPPEELYDLENDIDEINNLVDSPAHHSILAELKRVQQDWILSSRDFGFLPENEIHTRAVGSTPYETALDRNRYPLERIINAAERAASLAPGDTAELVAAFNDTDSAVRYWAALGLLMRKEAGISAGQAELVEALSDSAPAVRVAAAEALGMYGSPVDLQASLATLAELIEVEGNEVFVPMMALAALDAMEEKAIPLRSNIEAVRIDGVTRVRPDGNEIERLRSKILSDMR
ncbi:MAG: sulfatase-like hydrolase/transferase [Proteobacteria bacterium]|nr:sulfatase-like hydrolase/transferase [Pseudomonadota bacterium]